MMLLSPHTHFGIPETGLLQQALPIPQNAHRPFLEIKRVPLVAKQHPGDQSRCLLEQEYQQFSPGDEDADATTSSIQLQPCTPPAKQSNLRVEPMFWRGWGFILTPSDGPVTAESASADCAHALPVLISPAKAL